MSQEDIRRAVQLLVQAPDDALFAVRAELLAAFIGLKKRLRLSSDRCIEILDSLSAKTDEIKEKQADVARVIGEVSSRQADVRLQHIYAEQPGGKGFECRARAIFAYRSLGFEFEEYTIRQRGTSRVTELASDIRKADDRSSGHVQEFLREKGLENDGPSKKAVCFAIKILVLEKTFGNCGISWLVSFIFSKIRNLPYLSLPDICHLLSQRDGDYSNLGELASSFSNLIRASQQQYDAFVNSPDGISHDSDQDRSECLTEDQPISDLPAETDGLEASIEQNQASTVDLLASSSQSDISVRSSRSSRSSNTTPTPECSNSDTPDVPSLHDQVLECRLASDRGQTSKPGRIARADDDGEGPELRPSKRRRILSYSQTQNVRPPSIGSRSPIIPSNAPTPAHAYSDGLNSHPHARWRPSYMVETPIGSRQYPPSNTNFWSVVDDRAIDGSSSPNQSGPIPDTSNVPYGLLAMSEQHVQPFVHSNEEYDPQAVQPSPSSAFPCYSTEQNVAQANSVGQPHHEGHAYSLHGQRASSRMDQIQSFPVGNYASLPSAATQAQENHQLVQALRSSVQAQILESSVAEGRRDSYWESLTNNRSFRILEPDPCEDQFEQSSNWTQSVALDPVNFLEYLPTTAPAESLPLDPVNFLDYLPTTAPAESLPLDPVNFLDYLPTTAPAESLPLDPVNFLDYLSGSTSNQSFQTRGLNITLTDPSMVEAQQWAFPKTAVHSSSSPVNQL
ncbi:uncharacterized protein KD926_003178 [Aspergillus affinis]|uniref:uncharacterized protein n=1 Tax=Aspergillus affinis TaxID=1070780 RepID=UPI0022FF069C|nr:uncharacterized protein KD926_003178 [Aspergillus affinis]KAI9035638.1 hypothetical protein KD926_003178 [Aspergillus affinis]